jgi:hypothetical protein
MIAEEKVAISHSVFGIPASAGHRGTRTAGHPQSAIGIRPVQNSLDIQPPFRYFYSRALNDTKRSGCIMITEADTCRKYVLPKLIQAGWDNDPHSFTEQKTFTDGRIVTGVDVPTCKNIVIARVIGSMTEFKQIIGRGTRVRDDYDKLYFSILDYTGSATRLFADPDFDGDPALVTEESIDESGETTTTTYEIIEDPSSSATLLFVSG